MSHRQRFGAAERFPESMPPLTQMSQESATPTPKTASIPTTTPVATARVYSAGMLATPPQDLDSQLKVEVAKLMLPDIDSGRLEQFFMNQLSPFVPPPPPPPPSNSMNTYDSDDLFPLDSDATSLQRMFEQHDAEQLKQKAMIAQENQRQRQQQQQAQLQLHPQPALQPQPQPQSQPQPQPQSQPQPQLNQQEHRKSDKKENVKKPSTKTADARRIENLKALSELIPEVASSIQKMLEISPNSQFVQECLELLDVPHYSDVGDKLTTVLVQRFHETDEQATMAKKRTAQAAAASGNKQDSPSVSRPKMEMKRVKQESHEKSN